MSEAADVNETKNDAGNENIEFPEFIKTMQVELAELKSRIEKLTEYIKSSEFESLDDYRKALVAAQAGSMQSYANILSIRILNESRVFVSSLQNS